MTLTIKAGAGPTKPVFFNTTILPTSARCTVVRTVLTTVAVPVPVGARGSRVHPSTQHHHQHSAPAVLAAVPVAACSRSGQYRVLRLCGICSLSSMMLSSVVAFHRFDSLRVSRYLSRFWVLASPVRPVSTTPVTFITLYGLRLQHPLPVIRLIVRERESTNKLLSPKKTLQSSTDATDRVWTEYARAQATAQGQGWAK